MGLETRTVTGVLRKTDNSLWADAHIEFTPAAAFGASGEIVPGETVEIKTTVSNLNGAGGSFSVNLLTLTGGSTRYTCKLPDGKTFDFILIPGAATTLDKLLNGEL